MKKSIFISFVIMLGMALGSCSDDYDDTALWEEINNLKTQVEKLNSDLSKVQTTITKLESGKYVTNYVKTETGCTLTFSDGESVTIEDGEPGQDAPIIGIQEENGVYYWTLTQNGETTFLTKPGTEDEKLPVSGKTPVIGVDASGYWTVDGIQIKDGSNHPIKAAGASPVFTQIENNTDHVVLTLASGGTITLPKQVKSTIVISATSSNFNNEETKTFTLTLTNVKTLTFTKPDGWKVSVSGKTLSVTAPVAANTYAEQSGSVTLIGLADNTSCMAELKVAIGTVSYAVDGGAATSSAPTTAFSALVITTTGAAAVSEAQLKDFDKLATSYTLDLSGANYESTDFTTGLYQYNDKITSISLPKNIVNLKCTFENSSNLASVNLPSSLKTIGDNAFQGMDALKSLTIPEGVTTLGKMLFNFNAMMGQGQVESSLEEVIFPSTITSMKIGDVWNTYFFMGCSSLKKIVIKYDTMFKASETNGMGYGDLAGVPEDCVIYVPDAKADDYGEVSTSGGWSAYTIKKLSELQ